jgi:hypothetical protein
MYSQTIASSSCDKLLMGLNGGYAHCTKSTMQSYGQCLGKVSSFFFLNTSLNSWDHEGISCAHVQHLLKEKCK